jgi:outer membrane protein assembly factor BamE
VRFVLGTPLIADMFHADRWDYVFYREYPDKTREERRLSVFFENDRLARVEGDVVPEGQAAKPAASGGPDAGSTEKDR